MLLVNKFTEYLGLFIYFSDYVPIANDGLVCSGQDGWLDESNSRTESVERDINSDTLNSQPDEEGDLCAVNRVMNGRTVDTRETGTES